MQALSAPPPQLAVVAQQVFPPPEEVQEEEEEEEEKFVQLLALSTVPTAGPVRHLCGGGTMLGITSVMPVDCILSCMARTDLTR